MGEGLTALPDELLLHIERLAIKSVLGLDGCTFFGMEELVVEFIRERHQAATSATLVRALVISGACGHTGITRLLLEVGAFVSDLALKLSCKYGNLEDFRLLMERGTRSDEMTSEVMYLAAKYGHVDVVKELLPFSDNKPVLIDIAFKHASAEGHVDVLNELLKMPPQPNRDAVLENGLVESCKTGNVDIVKLLVENGADIHSDDDSALRQASFHGHASIVRFLISAGADVHTLEDFPLKWASFRGNLEVVHELIKAGADIDIDNGYCIRYASRNGHVEVVEALLASGADIHALDDDALQRACVFGHIDVVRTLIRSGADIHTNNNAPMRWASAKGHDCICKELSAAMPKGSLRSKSESESPEGNKAGEDENSIDLSIGVSENVRSTSQDHT